MPDKRQFLSFRSIRAKFLALIVPFVLLSILAVFGLVEYNARITAEQKLQSKLDKLVAIQSGVVAESLWNVADEQIKLILSALQIDPDVVAAAVYDDGDVRVTRGAGHYVNRPPFASYYEALKIKHELARPVAVTREAAE